jgi:cystathionine gamma-synthase
MYLAHYDMVMNAQGRGHLLEVGIDPDLIRISVGAEPYEVIESAIGSALSD